MQCFSSVFLSLLRVTLESLSHGRVVVSGTSVMTCAMQNMRTPDRAGSYPTALALCCMTVKVFQRSV